MARRKSLPSHSARGSARASGPATYRVTTLGSSSLSRIDKAGRRVHLLGPGKLTSFLVYLACAPGRRAPTRRLVELLWPDRDATSGHHNLRQTIWQARRRLGSGVIACTHGEVELRAEFASDRDEFVAAVEQGAMEKAVDLYKGEFLAGSVLTASPAFEEWTQLEGYRLRRLFTRAAETVTRGWRAAGRWSDAQRLAGRVRDADPQEEGSWVLLLETLLAAGAYLRAAGEADLAERVLATPRRVVEPTTKALLRRARRAAERAAWSSDAQSLPPGLVGRDREIVVLADAWQAARAGAGRHVHVFGGTGLGKTRFVSEISARLRAAGERVVSAPARFSGRRVSQAYIADVVTRLAEMPGAVGISPTTAAVLVALNPILSTRFPALPRGMGDADTLRHRALAVLELLNAVGDDAPLALVCDDLQWADPASADILGWVLDQIETLPLLCVTTSTVALASSGAQHVELGPLSPDAVHAFVSRMAPLPDAAWARELPTLLHEMTGGSPRLLVDQLQFAVEQGTLLVGEEWSCPDPTSLRAHLARVPGVVDMPILVSPFVPEGEDAEYLAMGITEGLIGELSRMDGVRVTALASAMQVARIADLEARAAAVGARYVLEGRVAVRGDSLDVAARLRDAVDGGAVLGEEICSGSRTDLLQQRDRIVRVVGRALHRSTRAWEGRSLHQSRNDLHAHECYMRARQSILRYEPGEIERGRQILRYGLQDNADSALLHACLGIVDFHLFQSGGDPDESRLQKAEEHAAKAAAAEPEALYTHLLAGSIAWARGRAQEAVRRYRSVLQQDPNHVEALLQLANLYCHAGKAYASRALLTRLFEIDPLSAVNHSVAGALLMFEGRLQEAMEGPYRTMFEMNPCPPVLLLCAMGHARMGNAVEARTLLDALPLSGAGMGATELAAFLRNAVLGRSRDTLRALTPTLERYSGFVFWHSWHIGAGLAMIGEVDNAFPYLRQAARLGFAHYPFLLIDPLLANMRNHPEWPRLVHEMRETWEDFEV